MAVSVLLFSSVTAFADTTVDSSNYTKEYFSNIHNNYNFKFDDNILSSLPPDDYLVIYNINGNYSAGELLDIYFVPRSATNYNYIPNINSNSELISYVKNNHNDNSIYIGYNSNSAFLCTSFDVYHIRVQKGKFATFSSFNPLDGYIWQLYYNQSSTINYRYDTFINDINLFNNISDLIGYKSMDLLTSPDSYYRTLTNVNNLFLSIVQLLGGYTGSVQDNSLNGLLSEYGKDCDTSILKQYKYQITYCQNNDIKMMFLNNNKAPKYTATDYDGVYPIARKYTFTYDNPYDCIVYFPQYQKYLNYDDWYNNKPEPNDFKWFWETDNKSFSLINDWTVTFNNGAPNYSGTRVIVGWEKSFNAATASMSDAWKIDKDKLINEGWNEGRPNDQNYPYQITIKQNGVPTFQIYMNSKPAIEVDRNNIYQCLYKIQMVPQCGYIYSFWADCYSKFDYTTKLVEGNDIISQGQNYVWNVLNTLGAYYDDKCMLHLCENFRGSTEPTSNEYIGTKVFFNWDISSKMINKNNDDDYDYSQLVNTGDKYVDNNGNIHGGSLSNYDSEDLNKYNDNGTSDNSSSSSGSLDFSYEGITSYCSDFFSFIKSVFNLFPAFIWVLVGASIAVLIALRVLGR